MINVAIFISGKGSNAQNIMQYFHSNSHINVKLLISNNQKSKLFNNIESTILCKNFQKKDFLDGEPILRELQKNKIKYIILAGFLLKIPSIIIKYFSQKIINIHPSLLPDFGGKGMYGMHVHNAVFNKKKQETGITIHEVNQGYDKGRIIFQAKCNISKYDNPKHIQKKVQILEHKFYPIIIEKFITSKNEN